MLLYLDESIQKDLKEDSNNFISTLAAIEYLSLAHSEGKHLVTGSRNTLLKIVSLSEHLSMKNITLFKKILQEVPQYGSMHKKLPIYSVIVNFDGDYQRSSSASQTTIYIPIKFFNDSSKIQPVNLVAENSDDTKIISHLCRAFCFRNRFNNLKFFFKPIMGGGDHTAKEYKALQDKGVFTICVVDSDRKHPADSIGETAKKVKLADDQSVFSDFRILECRELENLISSRQLAEACKNDSSRRRAVNFLENLEETSNGEKRLYLDFKNGLRLLDIFSYKMDSPARDYFGNFKDIICEFSHIDNDCITSGQCSEKKSCLTDGKKRLCKSIIMHSLGDKICEAVVKYLDTLSPQKLSESICKFTEKLWDTIGGFVFSWSCCGIRINT